MTGKKLTIEETQVEIAVTFDQIFEELFNNEYSMKHLESI